MPVQSNPFSIAVLPSADEPSFGVMQGPTPALPIIPGLRGWGYDTVAGSGRHLDTPATTVLFVDSLSTESVQTGRNSGSIRWCLEQAFPRTIVPRVSGLVVFEPDSVILVPNPYFTYAGQCAPSPGLHFYSVNLKVATHDALLWHWSGFMGNATSQGTGDNVQLGANSSTTDQVGLIMANCNLFFAWDENFSSFNSSQSYVSDFTIWQCLSALGQFDASGYGSLVGLNVQPAPRASVLRTYFAHNKRRNPRFAGGGIAEGSNNLGYDNDWNLEFESKDNGPAAIFNLRNSAMIRGPDGLDRVNSVAWFADANGWDPGGYYHLSGNAKYSDYVDALDIDNGTPDPVQPNPHEMGIPPGLVLRAIAPGDAGIREFAEVVLMHAGAYPMDRLSIAQQVVDHCLNYLDGSGDFGGQINNPADVTWPASVPENTVDHTDPAAHGGDPIPTGDAQDVIQPSGYTALEEWLHRRNGDYLPEGWHL